MIEWRTIPGVPNRYLVSNSGQVKSNGRFLSLHANQRGHYRARLSIAPYKSKMFSVSRLVALAFLENPNSMPNVLHIDGNLENNDVSNLKWGNQTENQYDAVKHNTHPQSSKTHCKRGHMFTAANTYIANIALKSGTGKTRTCKTCRAIRNQKHRNKS